MIDVLLDHARRPQARDVAAHDAPQPLHVVHDRDFVRVRRPVGHERFREQRQLQAGVADFRDDVLLRAL